MPTYFCVVRPEQVNGRLAAHGGSILLHLPNYFEVYPVKPSNTDDGFQVFEITVPEGEVRQYVDGDRTKHLLWKGDQHSRSRPQDLVSVKVSQCQAASVINPAEAAKQAFADLPPDVRLAGVIAQAPDREIMAATTVFKSLADVRAWADATLQKYVTSNKG